MICVCRIPRARTKSPLFLYAERGAKMAIKRIDLSGPIKRWKEARKGKEVRAANVEAFEQIQTVVNDSINGVNQAASDVSDAAAIAAQVAKDAATTVTRANETVDHADTILAETKRQANDILADTKQQAGNAADSAEQAESWAIGGTGKREGENTNNSEYHSKQAQTAADAARIEADRAAKYSSIVAPGFYFEPGNAALYFKSGVGVDFKVDDSRLYWKTTV